MLCLYSIFCQSLLSFRRYFPLNFVYQAAKCTSSIYEFSTTKITSSLFHLNSSAFCPQRSLAFHDDHYDYLPATLSVSICVSLSVCCTLCLLLWLQSAQISREQGCLTHIIFVHHLHCQTFHTYSKTSVWWHSMLKCT